ncbi:hypothetical protein [Halalkalibacter krulwichiae]|uniref:Small peptidoglycan-associated lipoprotein n=2 Tax=Halalkalibacter krulwichiae TaxID=199441 RepID=A0A1X9MCK6_9BACI|nr:hypothetical protein [Halalkalibacter krulwichiae]ARK31169.1 hypothetical protein BkAM31D_15640 [Halalkalibacter krulwichiae]
MDKYIEMMIISSMLFLSSCFPQASSIENPISQDQEQTITVLFSDSSNLHEEKTYYDALLELKQKDPVNAPSLMIIDSEERDAIRYFNIEQFPTMIVLTGEKENLRVEGSLTKDEILGHLKEVFQIEKDAASLSSNRLFSNTY